MQAAQVRVLLENGVDEIFIFIRIKGAADIHETSAGGEDNQAGFEQGFLQACKDRKILGAAFGLDVRPAAEHSQAGTRNIQEDALRFDPAQRRGGCISSKQGNIRQVKPGNFLPTGEDLVGINIAGPQVMEASFQQLTGLQSPSGTGIPNRLGPVSGNFPVQGLLSSQTLSGQQAMVFSLSDFVIRR